MISMKRKTTIRTMEYSLRQCEFMPFPALRTGLRDISRIDLNDSFTGPCCLVDKTIQKDPPCGVSNTFIQPPEAVCFHGIDGKILNTDRIMRIHDLSGGLMHKIVPFVRDAFMHTSDNFPALRSFRCAFFRGTQFSLGFFQRLFFFSEKAGVFDDLASIL